MPVVDGGGGGGGFCGSEIGPGAAGAMVLLSGSFILCPTSTQP